MEAVSVPHKHADLSDQAKALLEALIGKAAQAHIQHATAMLNLPQGQFSVTVQRVRGQ